MPVPQLTVTQLLTPVTPAQARATGALILQSLGLSPQSWLAGSTSSSLLTYIANVYSQGTNNVANTLSSFWLNTALGSGLQLLAKNFYGVTPSPATFATGLINLDNTGGGGIFNYAPFTAFFASIVPNSSGVFPTYTNLDPIALAAGGVQTGINVQCTFQGAAGSAAPGTVTKLVTSMQSVKVNNPTPIVGLDAISDNALKTLCLASIGSRSVFGPSGAYIRAISTAVNSITGNPVNVNKSNIQLVDHLGNIVVTVAAPSGVTDPNDVIGVYNSIVSNALVIGPNLTVNGAIGIEDIADVTCYITAPTGTSVSALQTTATNALTVYFAGQGNPIGGYASYNPNTNSIFYGLQAATLQNVIAAAISEQFPSATLLAQQGLVDLALSSNQIAVNNITVNSPVVNFF